MKTLRMKRSNVIISIVLAVLASAAVGHAFYISNNVKPIKRECKSELELGKGDFFENECFFEYSHLHVSVPDVELINKKSNYVKMEGYENAWWVQDMEVRNDTLYISKKDPCMPNYLTDESINAVKYFIGGKGLESITVSRGGSIKHPLKPYAAHANGEPVYKPNDLAYHTYEFDSLKVLLLANGYIDIFLDGGHLTLERGPFLGSFRTSMSRSVPGRAPLSGFGYSVLFGQVDELTVMPSHGGVNLQALHLKVKKAIVNPDRLEIANSGNIEVSVSEHLEAYLYGKGDVSYVGKPTITKEETDYGRVIDISHLKSSR